MLHTTSNASNGCETRNSSHFDGKGWFSTDDGTLVCSSDQLGPPAHVTSERIHGIYPALSANGIRFSLNLGATPFRYAPPDPSFDPVGRGGTELELLRGSDENVVKAQAIIVNYM
jgi:hypothetical protein